MAMALLRSDSIPVKKKAPAKTSSRKMITPSWTMNEGWIVLDALHLVDNAIIVSCIRGV